MYSLDRYKWKIIYRYVSTSFVPWWIRFFIIIFVVTVVAGFPQLVWAIISVLFLWFELFTLLAIYVRLNAVVDKENT